MSDFQRDEENKRDQWTPEKRAEVIQHYLRRCGKDSVFLKATPLQDVIAYPGVTVVEADNSFVLMSHLKTALAKRQEYDLVWDLVYVREFLDRLMSSETPQADRDAVRQGFDPLVIHALSWASSPKQAIHVASVLRDRDSKERPTLLVVRRLGDILGDCDPTFRDWLTHDVPRVSLTAASVRETTIQPEKLNTIWAHRPSLSRVDRSPRGGSSGAVPAAAVDERADATVAHDSEERIVPDPALVASMSNWGGDKPGKSSKPKGRGGRS